MNDSRPKTKTRIRLQIFFFILCGTVLCLPFRGNLPKTQLLSSHAIIGVAPSKSTEKIYQSAQQKLFDPNLSKELNTKIMKLSSKHNFWIKIIVSDFYFYSYYLRSLTDV